LEDAVVFKLIFPGGEPIERLDAHSALQDIQYLDRDGYGPITIIDPQGNKISREKLGKLAFQLFTAHPHA
jgi:hypothetical protein